MGDTMVTVKARDDAEIVKALREIVNVDTPELEHIEPLPVDVYCVQISDAQIAFIRALIAKKPEKYAPLLV
jgi:hypothetical protein